LTSLIRSLEFDLKSSHIYGFSIGLIDYSEVAYFLLGHPVHMQIARSSTCYWHYTIPHSPYVFILVCLFLSQSCHSSSS